MAESAEKLAKRIESRAISAEKSLMKFSQKEAKGLKEYLDNAVKIGYENVKTARKAYKDSNNEDRETKVSLYKQIGQAQQTAKIVEDNAKIAAKSLYNLQIIIWRMLPVMRKIRKDARNVVSFTKDSARIYKKIEHAQKMIGINCKFLKASSRLAEMSYKSINAGKVPPEEMLIKLVQDMGSAYSARMRICDEIINADELFVLPFLQSLQNALREAYKAEEASRLANDFYEKLMKAAEELSEMIVESDFPKPVKDTFAQELQIERLEEQIAQREGQAAQAVKGLFIKAANALQSSAQRMLQNIQITKELIAKSKETKDQFLYIFGQLMRKLNEHKVMASRNLAAKAQENLKSLNDVRFEESKAGLAAAA
ncbi:hypothetical protein HYS31_06840 [Candidatus Woesearchaeota archaeon]|nr:hypothetical protein [Candidatus Woesearchaeota archaeon]